MMNKNQMMGLKTKWFFVLYLFFATSLIAGEKHIAIGVVNAIDNKAEIISINHEPIESLGMSAMTMDFPVKDVEMLGKIKVGQKVKFVLTVDDFGLLIISEIQ